ncbi:MAG: hypothetical protein A4E52_00455 [Pelotomaculum sp. PtaB.Bin013]|uniref:DUF881 domain-containing protein n=1 Tax=Pelotomaculum isophthalicicum JI TaxID=947010 RepID=A0A9X4H1R8_9FIRM|nr:DUF881 domain-containing protein [Pelotomaculum isophthalicicum]MDF9408391.1 DUF881 domain-containing protein [Pelotomaculum isophthalicicum JI]OPX91559.1 MAG: hypothetical protein A4E52_00455 [Pelotomaculum sp. PtaB.Bin013]
MSTVRLKNIYWSVALASLVLGVILAVQFRITSDMQHNEAIQRTQELAQQVEQMKKEHEVLQTQLLRMRGQLESLSTESLTPQIKEEMELATIFAGITKLTGSGVEVTLRDNNASPKFTDNPNANLVHDEDILRVVNELKAAGAEAVAINGQRVIAATEISCNGPTIRINKKALAPPFVITAIGSPETLESALKMRGGVVDYLQFFGIQISVKKLEQLTIPAYSGSIKSDYIVEKDIDT